jgi:hypothetical protein
MHRRILAADFKRQARRGYGMARIFEDADALCAVSTMAANALKGAIDNATAIAQNAAAYRLTPRALASAAGANQLPVRIAR